MNARQFDATPAYALLCAATRARDPMLASEPLLCVCVSIGDHARVAAQVANTVGIDSWRAGMKPENKLEYVKSFGAIQPGR